MLNANSSRSKWSMIVLTLAMVAAYSVPVHGQDAAKASPQSGGYLDDWTTHHVVFSNPGTEEDAIKNGTHEQWLKIVNDPRYAIQQQKRSMRTLGVTTEPNLFADQDRSDFTHGVRRPVFGNFHRTIPIEKDWSQNLGGSQTTDVVSIATLTNGTNISGSSTITVDGQTLTTSAPVAESAKITVSTNNYCVPAGGGVTVGTTPTSIVTNGTAPTGTGSLTVGSGTGTTGLVITVGGVAYTYENSLATTGCGTTLNCLLGGQTGTTGHDADAEALYRAVNNAGSCTDNGTQTCYSLATGQGANAVATASHTALTAVTTVGTWMCAGAAATQWTAAGCTMETCTNPTGGSNGTTGIILPATMTAANLASAISTAITSAAPAGITHSYTSGNTFVTLTASALGSTGFTNSLDGSVTGVTDSVTTAGFNGPGNTSTTFNYWNGNAIDTPTQLATNLATAVGLNPNLTGVVFATPGTNQITFSAGKTGTFAISDSAFTALSGVGNTAGVSATVQPNAYPAKYGASLTTASCSDFVVYPTGQAGSNTAATIIAYTNLYSSCGSPSVAWAYNTGTGYAITTSPTLSLDGTEVLFVQSNGTNSQLVVLKPGTGSGTLTSPASVTAASGNNITSSCASACFASTLLTSLDTYSTPYYGYTGDKVFVGTNSGTLDGISPVLSGAMPATAASVSLTGAGNVTSPVYDNTSGCVFVGDSNGYLFSVDSGLPGGATCKSGTFVLHGYSALLGENSAGIYDGPLVDSSPGTIYAFIGAASAASGCTAGANCVVEFATTLTGSGTATPATHAALGGASTAFNPIYSGSFDNTYYSSGTGHIWVVGGTGLATAASLYEVPVGAAGITAAAAVAKTVTAGGGTSYPWPSPVTEFLNGGTDYAFFSVNNGASALCPGSAVGTGCILSFTLSGTTATQAGSGQNYVTPGTNGCWSTGGLVIDNSAAAPGSEIYFVNLNGIAAGGLDSSADVTQASSNCSPGATSTIQGIQAAQANP